MNAPAARLPAAQDLRAELTRVMAAGQPLVVLVSLEGCVFCEAARRSHLVPGVRESGWHVVQVDLRSRMPVRGWRGEALTHDELARSWKASVTPTLLFFGRDGAEVADRMVGGYIPDFYGAYLDERLRTARRSLAR